MQLRRLFLRYFPPALRLEYAHSNGQVGLKTINLPHLSAESNIALVAQQLIDQERLLTKTTASKIKELLHRLVDKHLVSANHQQSSVLKAHSVLRPHQLPMTNMACSKSAKLIATSSYDKTIRLLRPFDPPTTSSSSLSSKHCEREVAALAGHEGVVFSLAFNKPYATQLLSGSFDKTCRLWDVQTKSAVGVYRGHAGEVVGVAFASGAGYNSDCFGSCSVDGSAIVWDAQTENPRLTLSGHTAEVSCLTFDSAETKLIATGSCDSTVRLWDTRYGGCFRCIEQHDAEISSVSFDYQANTLLSSSADGTCKLWDARTGKCALVVACGSDGKAFIYDTLTGIKRCTLAGHHKAVNKVCFSMQGLQVLTASTDGTARVWNSFSGECLQVLRGHDAEVFDCYFSYDGSVALTASIDNSVRVWEREAD